MNILALETATEACSAALSLDGEVLERYQIAPRQHAQLILGMMDELLAEAGITLAQLDALAFGRGPGSFIGVRIAAGVAQGIAFAQDLPVVPVSTLAALAQGVDQPRVLAAIDARMHEVYWAAYERDEAGIMQLLGEEALTPADQVVLPSEPDAWFGAGTGWHDEGPQLARHLPQVSAYTADAFPHAGSVAHLGEAGFRQGRAVAAEQAQPVYLRDQVANKPQ
jgi:tRNA threonylcarbamoyladenosine biosynthesis protein TsaB